MSEIEVVPGWTYDGGKPVQVLNTTDVDTRDIAADPQAHYLASQLTQWVEKARATPQGGFLDRSTFSFADNPYDNMRAIRDAVTYDDVIGAVADSTEALAFEGGLKWESAEPDDADVFNQLSAQWNLDNVIRVMWRDCFRYEQSVVAKLWAYQDFTVRGKTAKGNARKKVYRNVWAPIRLVTLNNLQVVPIFNGPLRNDDLAWQGSEVEMNAYRAAVAEDIPTDPLMTQFFTGSYRPSPTEAATLGKWGVDTQHLLALNPDWVFRHTTTRADYEQFSELRLRSVLPLLDLKRQLIASDRATLVGAANYILLIRKGSDEKPATPNEMSALRENYNFLAKIPVIISDHRLEIDIIAPSQDFALSADKYDTLDKRILARSLAAFTASHGGGSSTASASTFENVLAKNIQNRRHMIKRTLEKELARAIVEHPRNAGKFTAAPSLVFTPHSVSVGQNQYYMSTLLAMRNSREISRDTILEYMGLDEATEAQRLLVEEELYDAIFKTVSSITGQQQGTGSSGSSDSTDTQDDSAPDDQQETTPPPTSTGRRGGRPVGGRTPGKPAKPGRNGNITDNGNPSTGA